MGRVCVCVSLKIGAMIITCNDNLDDSHHNNYQMKQQNEMNCRNKIKMQHLATFFFLK